MTPPPLNQPSLITQLPEIPISILISQHLSTKLTTNLTNSIQDLIDQKSWKTLTEVIGHQIIKTDINQTQHLLKLWSIRFECLMRLNQIKIISKELNQFFKLLNKSNQLNKSNLYELIPFSILIIKSRLPFLLNQNQISLNKSINLIYELIKYCKLMILKNLVELNQWKNRLNWLNSLMVSILNGNESLDHQKLIKIDYDLINELIIDQSYDSISKSQIWIENGDLNSFENHLKFNDDDHHQMILNSFLDVAKGDWNSCELKCKEVLQNATLDDSNLIIHFNNSLALSLLYQGKISEALEIMKSLINSIKQNHSSITSLIFNLITILELSSINSHQDKLNLLNQFNSKFSIESLNPIVFKLD